MGESLEGSKLHLRIFATWICYLSFFRGFVSFFAGYVVSIVPISISFFIMLLPPLVVLIPAKYDSSRYIIVAILFWLGGILTDFIWFKLIFLMVGASFTFLALRYDFEHYNLENLKWFPFIFVLDLLIRSPNMGQDLFVSSNFISKITGTVLVFSSIYYLESNESIIENTHHIADKKLNIDQLIFSLTFFMIMVIYSVELAGPGILVLNDLTNQPSAMIGSVVVFFIIAYFTFKFNNKFNYKHAVLSGLVLGFSIYFYPWYGGTLIFWLLSILTIQILFQINLGQFKMIDGFERGKYILLGHYLITIVMLYGLLTESYLLMPLISVLVGVAFIKKRTPKKNKFFKLQINFSGIKNKIITVSILLLLISPFVPIKPAITELESTNNVRIMTYNLHFGISGNGNDNGFSVINVIKETNPTIIAFQEVTFAASINGYKNMYSFLKSELEPLGYSNSYFSKGGKYQTRNVIFSKLQMRESKTTLLSPRVTYERNIIETKVMGENFELMIYATHLTHVIEKESNPDRVTQAIQVMDIINPDFETIPVILLGDFNAEPDWKEIDVISSKLTDAWEENNGFSNGYTWPNDAPRQRIDYIFYSSLISVESCSVISSSASDHLPVICEFNL